jgi:hypothetical protein
MKKIKSDFKEIYKRINLFKKNKNKKKNLTLILNIYLNQNKRDIYFIFIKYIIFFIKLFLLIENIIIYLIF